MNWSGLEEHSENQFSIELLPAVFSSSVTFHVSVNRHTKTGTRVSARHIQPTALGNIVFESRMLHCFLFPSHIWAQHFGLWCEHFALWCNFSHLQKLIDYAWNSRPVCQGIFSIHYVLADVHVSETPWDKHWSICCRKTAKKQRKKQFIGLK